MTSKVVNTVAIDCCWRVFILYLINYCSIALAPMMRRFVFFNLIEYNVFSKTESDRPEDFADVYTFEEAFVKPYLPSKRRTVVTE